MLRGLGVGLIIGVILGGATALWSQPTGPPITPCDVRLQIVEQGRVQAEQQWAAALIKIQELQQQHGAAPPKTPAPAPPASSKPTK